MNEYALQALEAQNTPPSIVARVLQFSLPTSNPTAEVMTGTFLLSMDNTGGHLVRLREEAEASVNNLTVFYETIHRDSKDLANVRKYVLSKFLTRLGWNKGILWGIEHILGLLENVEKARSEATARAVASLQTLRDLETDIHELRTKVAIPEIAGDQTPIGMHIKSIKAGMESLKEAQMRVRSRKKIVEMRTLLFAQRRRDAWRCMLHPTTKIPRLSTSLRCQNL